MFQDDSIKEEPSKIVGNFDDSNIEEIEEDTSLSHPIDKGFFFMFENSFPAPEVDVCEDVHFPSLDEELLSLMKD